MNEVLKSVVAQYNAPQLLTSREQISYLIRNTLQERAADFSIVLDDVSITELSFGQEFSHAIEEKQVAQQRAERAKYEVDRAEQEKKSAIIRAQGQAKSAELYGKAMAKNQAFIQLKRLEAAKEIVKHVAKSRNRVYLDADTLLLNITGKLDENLEKIDFREPKNVV